MEAPAKNAKEQKAETHLSGNKDSSLSKGSPFFQPKLAVSDPNDKFEQEADTVADQVATENPNTTLQTKISTVVASHACVQREDDDEQTTTIQRQEVDQSALLPGVPSIVNEVLQASGQPLDNNIRSSMESSFGYDFSSVRIHTNQQAAQSAQSINALAYTAGNNIVFNRGQFAPQTHNGKKLLAHELTHVIQQGGGIQAKRKSVTPTNDVIIQRDGNDETPIVADLGYGIVFQQWINHGQALLTYRGRQWMIFQWTGGLSDRVMSVGIARAPETNTLAFVFSAAFPVTVRINNAAEQYAAGIAGGTLNLNYRFRFPGTARSYENGAVIQTSPTPSVSLRHIEGAPMPVLTEGELGSVEGSGPNYLLPSAPPLRDFSRVWSFGSQQAFNQFAASHPDTNWACVVMPDGRFLAYALTREAIHRFARNVRSGTYHQDFASEFNGRVSNLFIHGQELSSLEELGNLYYEDRDEAALGLGAPMGMSGIPNLECAVYEMGDGTYGRKPLTHDQALQMWRTLSTMPIADTLTYEVEPGHRFVELNVHGRSSIHSIDHRYFTGRDSYYSFIATTRAAGSQPSVAPNTDEMRYMLIEVDRPDINVSFQNSLAQNETLATDLQEQVYHQVEEAGQRAAIRLLRNSHARLNQMATNRDTLNGFIAGFHSLNAEEKVEALMMLGLVRHPPGTLPFMVAHMENSWYDDVYNSLSDVNQARRVLLGLNPFVVQHLQQKASETASGIQQVITALENRSVIAIRAEGDLGVQARNIAYRDMGFTRLHGNTYPHTGEVDASLPGPMSGNTASFGSIAEQLYANRIVRMNTEERIMRFVGISLAILGAAALMILSGGIGSAAAGLFFAEGTAAFIATEIVVGGLTLTALNEGVAQIAGRGEFRANDIEGSVARLGVSAVSNILTFGVFRGLNAVFGALGRAAVGGGTIVAGSGRAIVAGGIRLTGLFATTYFSSIVAARIRDGHYPDSRELVSLFYENALTLLALEVGGRLAQPLTQEANIWARGRRLGPQNIQRIDALTADITTLQTDVANYIENPAGSPVTDLITRQQQMLVRQQEVVNQLRESARGTGDAEVIDRMATEELQRIEETLALIREVQFISDTHMRSAGADDTSFYYREGSVARIREFYGANNVQGPDAQGVLRVTHEGHTLTFRPEPAAGSETAAPVGGNTATGAVRGNVYELGTAGGAAETLRTRAGTGRLSVSHLFRFLTSERVTNPANPSEITSATIQSTLRTRMHGSTLSWTPGQPYFDFTVPVAGRPPVTVRVTVKYQGLDTRGIATEPIQAGPHGADTGPVTYRLVYEGGRLNAIIDVNPDIRVNPGQLSRSTDLEIAVGHELDEVADITRQIFNSTTQNQAVVDTVLGREAQAVVFRPGSTASATNLTAHDRAAAAQLHAHFLELATGPNGELRFTRMLESMGLTGRTTSSEFIEFRRALELSNQTDAAFLNRIEIQWRLMATQRTLSTVPPAQLLPGGQRVITPTLIEHVLFPHSTSPGDFPGSGISGGHATTNLESLNTDASSPYLVVREGTMPLGPGRYAHRYHQYRFIGSGTKASAPSPTRVPGGAAAAPTPGTHYDSAFWEVSSVPKSTVDDMNAFLPQAELAFAQYFRTNIAGNSAANGQGRLFRVLFDGVTYMGYYNYDGTTVSLNSIFVDATTIP